MIPEQKWYRDLSVTGGMDEAVQAVLRLGLQARRIENSRVTLPCE